MLGRAQWDRGAHSELQLVRHDDRGVDVAAYDTDPAVMDGAWHERPGPREVRGTFAALLAELSRRQRADETAGRFPRVGITFSAFTGAGHPSIDGTIERLVTVGFSVSHGHP